MCYSVSVLNQCDQGQKRSNLPSKILFTFFSILLGYVYRSLRSDGRHHGFIHYLVLLKANLVALVWCNVSMICTRNRSRVQKLCILAKKYAKQSLGPLELSKQLSCGMAHPRINLKYTFWGPSLIDEFSYITYYCIFMLHINVYFRFLLVTLSEHALFNVDENSHFSTMCIGKSFCTLKSAALPVSIALKCSLPFCRWPGGLHGPRLLLTATMPR